jgi:hypothetical protein
LEKYAVFLEKEAVVFAKGGCFLTRVPRVFQNHGTHQRFPVEGFTPDVK